MVERGKINYRERSLQVKDYSGLLYKNITPTDIDGFFEIQNKVFIFIELKLENAPIPKGQLLALERIADNINKATLLIIAEHNYPKEKDIDVANCIVSQWRYKRIWHYKDTRTAKMLIDSFLNKMGFEDYVK